MSSHSVRTFCQGDSVKSRVWHVWIMRTTEECKPQSQDAGSQEGKILLKLCPWPGESTRLTHCKKSIKHLPFLCSLSSLVSMSQQVQGIVPQPHNLRLITAVLSLPHVCYDKYHTTHTHAHTYIYTPHSTQPTHQTLKHHSRFRTTLPCISRGEPKQKKK